MNKITQLKKMTKTELLEYAKKNNFKISIIEDIKYKNGHYWITKSIKDFDSKLFLLALEQKQAITGYDVYNILDSIKEFGVDATLFAIKKEPKDGWDVYRIAKEIFNEGNN